MNEEEISHQNSHYRINRVCLDMTPINTSFHLLRIIGMKSDAVSWTIGNSVRPRRRGIARICCHCRCRTRVGEYLGHAAKHQSFLPRQAAPRGYDRRLEVQEGEPDDEQPLYPESVQGYTGRGHSQGNPVLYLRPPPSLVHV